MGSCNCAFTQHRQTKKCLTKFRSWLFWPARLYWSTQGSVVLLVTGLAPLVVSPLVKPVVFVMGMVIASAVENALKTATIVNVMTPTCHHLSLLFVLQRVLADLIVKDKDLLLENVLDGNVNVDQVLMLQLQPSLKNLKSKTIN